MNRNRERGRGGREESRRSNKGRTQKFFTLNTRKTMNWVIIFLSSKILLVSKLKSKSISPNYHPKFVFYRMTMYFHCAKSQKTKVWCYSTKTV